MRNLSILVGAMALVATPLNAQAIKSEPPMESFSEEDIAAIEYPELKFEETPAISKNYKKYFYFHRENTGFDEAFADISECDSLSSGLRYYRGNSEPYPGYYGSQYGLGGVIGSAIGNALANAIYGSAERRKIRRINMRRCMGFKEYDRYGLEKGLWKEFHFEEGHGSVEPEKRRAFLLRQALVASETKPAREAIQK